MNACLRTLLLTLASASLLLAGGCGSLPAPGETVLVASQGTLTQEALQARRDAAAVRPLLQAAGIGPAELAAGRVLRVQCAVMSDGWWDSLAILPADAPQPDGRAMRLRVSDSGTNERIAVNQLLGPAEPEVRGGGLAYRLIPDWKQRGLSTNYEPVPLPQGQKRHFLVVQGSYMVKCRP
jgi:hypothetical protein